MRFAFSTLMCPDWTLAQVTAAAKAHGYAGVEWGADRSNGLWDGSADRSGLSDHFAESNLQVCCVDTGISYSASAGPDRLAADVLRRAIDAARSIRSPAVAVAGTTVRRGANRSSSAVAMGDWLLPIGDYALERGVRVLIRNELSFRRAGELWLVLDRLSHPAIACAWDVVNGAVAGESPAVSVPTLNSRIVQVHVDDVKIGEDLPKSVPLGLGDVPLTTFFTRMRGIGFTGWVVYSPRTQKGERASDASLPAAMKYFLDVVEPRPMERAKGSVKPASRAGTGLAPPSGG